ncbi:MAG: hypothetical protein ABS949_17015 [Solibacillus sp.]
MNINIQEHLKNDNVEVDVMMGIGEKPIFIPFVLDKDQKTVQIFFKMFDSDEHMAKEGIDDNLELISSSSFESYAEAEQFYYSLQDGQYVSALLDEYLRSGRKKES